MKKLITSILAALVCVLGLAGCSSETGTIQFHDKAFNRSDLSQETIEWLEWYNRLTETEQLSISSIPSDLYKLYGYPQAEELEAVETGKEKWDLIPMVMVNGELYLDTGHESNAVERTDHFDGEITSEVDGSEKPTVSDQSNFGTEYGYQYGSTEGTVEIYMNGKWRIFATEEVRQQIQFPENDRETGSERPDTTTFIAEICDRAEEEGLPCDEAEEKFYEDENTEYYFSVIKSHYIMVTYNNGNSEDIVTALNAGRATIADLDEFDIKYHTEPKTNK